MDDAVLSSGWVGAWAALVGACVGSFLNVVIARVPAGDSIVSPGSRCPRCRRPIAWYDNVPVLSWLVLRGRCRSCRAPISLRYPAVELAGAAFAVLAWARHGLGGPALAELVLVAILLALALIDLDTWLLPHGLTVPLAVLGVGASALGWSRADGPLASLLGAAVGFGVFGLIWLLGERVLRRELLGLGDAFLLAGIGAWFGLAGLLPVVLLASFQGSVFGVAQLLLGRGQPGPERLDAGDEGVVPEASLPAPSEVAQPADPPAPVPEPPPIDGRLPSAEAAGAEPAAGGAAAPEWIPPRHAIPFGPFLVAAALEWLYLSGELAALVPTLRAFL